MAKTKISEFSSTPGNNTDIDGINIAEGCAPSGINDAIRELMAQLKDFQAGTAGDSFNGPVGTTTAAAGAFTTLSSTGNTTLGDAAGDTVTVNGTATFANANPTLSAGTANGVAYLNGSKVLTTGSALVFDGSNLGLGVTPSAWGASFKALEIGGAGTGLFSGTGTTPQTYLTANAYFNGTNWIYKGSAAAARYSQSASGHEWSIATSGTAGNAISFTQAMTLDASGNLSNVGNIDAGSAKNIALNATNSTDVARLQWKYGGTAFAWIERVNADGSLAFGVQSSERARIDSSGNLLVGTTSGSGQSDRIYSSGTVGITATTPQINFYGSGSTIEFVNRNAGGSKTFSWYYQASGGGTPATLSTSGVWTNASDARGKENISDIHYGLGTVLALQPRQYDVKSDGSHAVGFVAQEVLPIVPELVHVTKRDEDNEFYGLDYGSMTAVLVKAIQELNAKVEAQAAEIAALKGN